MAPRRGNSLLDARAGTLHRNLTQSLEIISAMEREIQQQGQEMSADIPAPAQAVIDAARAYYKACQRAEPSAMLKTYTVLGRAVERLNGDSQWPG